MSPKPDNVTFRLASRDLSVAFDHVADSGISLEEWEAMSDWDRDEELKDFLHRHITVAVQGEDATTT